MFYERLVAPGISENLASSLYAAEQWLAHAGPVCPIPRIDKIVDARRPSPSVWS
jgi:hypothetical protein